MSARYSTSKDDELGYIIPLIVLKQLPETRRVAGCWRTVASLCVGRHRAGDPSGRYASAGPLYRRFYLGIYAPTAVWGPSWLRVSFFRSLLCLACRLLSMAETVTVPHITASTSPLICGTLLGIDIIQEGVQMTTTLTPTPLPQVQRAAEPDRYAAFTIYGFAGVHKMSKTGDHPIGIPIGRCGKCAG